VERDSIDAASEFAFLGLRLTEGIDLDGYQTRYGIDLVERFQGQLERVGAAGLIELSAGRLKLTRKGMLYSNEVFEIFVSGRTTAAFS
jgi:oxygen-independent coproporphyrinogen-3 oxidase